MTDQYKVDITAAFVKLTSAEMEALSYRKTNGDLAARDTLVCSCLPLVYDIAQKFRRNNWHIDLEDMIQHGNVALIRAVDDWDHTRARLSTLATWYVRNSLIDMIKESKYCIKNKFEMSRQSCDDMRKIRDADSNDIIIIKEKTGLTEKRIKLLQRIMSSKRIGYDICDMRLHTYEEYESQVDSNIDGCLAELIELVEEVVDDEDEKDIFFYWLRHVHKNNKTRLTADGMDSSLQDVSRIVRKTKKAVRTQVRSNA